MKGKKIFEAELVWPERNVSPNVSAHWRDKNESKRNEKQTGIIEAKLTTEIVKWKPTNNNIHLVLVFMKHDNRKHDLDNLLSQMKPRLDGICEHLQIDDCQFRPITLDLKVWKKDYDAVWIRMYSG